jgi:hypothetical protein
MADHRIRLTLPSLELDGRDVTFEVFIDGKKEGELRVSEGGLDWWPRGAKTQKHVKSWSQLRGFMEA